MFHYNKGFDVVIANPPYVSKNALQKQSADMVKTLRASYETANGRDFDLFGCFIEKGTGILRPNGTLTFIVASGWYTGPGFGALRRFIARETDPFAFINLPYDAILAIHRRIRCAGYDTLGTMKALFSIFLALGVCVGSVQAGPVRTARNVAKSTAITAKNVAHSAVKGTRRAVHTVVYTVTP